MPAKPIKRRTSAAVPAVSSVPVSVPHIDSDAPIASDILSLPVAAADASIELTGALADPDESLVEVKNRWLYQVGLMGTVGIIAVSVGIWAMSQATMHQTPSSAALPAQAAIIVPVAQTLPVVDKSAWVFEVYNGSGVAGRAGTVAQKIRALGYTVVTVGNADTTQKDTSLQVRTSVSSSLAAVLSELTPILTIATTSSALSGTTASARLVIGTK